MKQYNKILEAINRGIQVALDDYQDIEDNNSISQYNDVINSEENVKQLVELNKITVDLDLPSGTLWCKYNVGVNLNKLNNLKDYYGNFYAWGEIETKKIYNWETYKWADGQSDELIKYVTSENYVGYFDKDSEILLPIDNITKLQLEDDAAYQNMSCYNFKFKIPTKEQFGELLQYTKNKWVEDYKGISRLNGYLFIGKNGNELFLPAAGFCDNKQTSHYGSSAWGVYWTSELQEVFPSASFIFQCNITEKNTGITANYRYCGFSIRPILLQNK